MSSVQSEKERHENRLKLIKKREDAGLLTKAQADQLRADENERHAKIMSQISES